tara:strand:+ start:1317 stop:1502 length:186 start_codon:yes stop_codon:yes gene_type:complete
MNMTRLVLTRKLDEEVVLHKDEQGVLATIRITKIDRNQVRLTFEANEDLLIDRAEVLSGNI